MLEIKGRLALTRDGVLKTTTNGTAVADCGGADNTIVNKATGEKVATFYELVAWKENAEKLAGFKKGEVVEVEGLFMSRPWTDKQGHERLKLQITVNEISKYVSSRSGESAKTDSSAKPANSGKPSAKSVPKSEAPTGTSFVDIPDDDDDELPF